MASRYVVYRDDVDPEQAPGSGVEERIVIPESTRSSYLTETIVTVPPRTTAVAFASEYEELLFVLRGRGIATVNGTAEPFGPESGIYIASGEKYELELADYDGAEFVRVIVIRPRDEAAEVGPRRTVSALDDQAIGQATAGREYRVLADPATGFRFGTHFVGDVPPGEPAPLHYHLYDEVIYVLQGTGVLHIDGESNPLYPGACIHLPARTLHQVENTGDIPMREVAVFVPAGSPAAAYLPDGTSAYENQPDDPEGGTQ